MDVKGAYLSGILKEKVYMCQPKGYEDGTGRVYLLIKTLYGLKQAGHEWNIVFDRIMNKLGYNCLKLDLCMYVRCHRDYLAIVTVWVDNLLLFALSYEEMEKIKNKINQKWEVTDLGEPSKIMGIKIMLKDHTIMISQQKYIKSILRREGLDHANPVSTPLDPNVPLESNPDGNEGDRSNPFAKLVRKLQFLANTIWPDIAYAIN
jgi:hypothetical protein